MALASSTTGSFEQSITVLGLLLVFGALIAGVARRELDCEPHRIGGRPRGGFVS